MLCVTGLTTTTATEGCAEHLDNTSLIFLSKQPVGAHISFEYHVLVPSSACILPSLSRREASATGLGTGRVVARRMQGTGPGIDQLVQLLLQDSCFAQAVHQQDGAGAATAAVGVLKNNWKAFSTALCPPGAGGPAPPADGGSPTALKRPGSEAGRRMSDPGAAPRPDIRVKDRVIINTNHKRYEGNLVGKEGVVLNITPNGWVKLQVGSDMLDIQMRHLTPVHTKNTVGTANPAVVSSLAAAGAGYKSSGLFGLKGVRCGGPRKSEVVKQVRKELTQLEEQVPWKEVQDRWRTHRKSWTRRLRQADSTRDIAIAIRDFHENLKTDKSSGMFMAGGAWELSLKDCITGSGNHLQLMQVWEDMRGALQQWLAAGQLPGGLASLDKASYAQAVHTYQVLQEAASRGPEFLEQVPLDQILTSQKELLALQHVIQREAAAAHSRLQAIALGQVGPIEAGTPPTSAVLAPLVIPDLEGGLTEGMLLQLGKLPRIKTHEGPGSDVDTDRDMGSEATDLDEDMDIY